MSIQNVKTGGHRFVLYSSKSSILLKLMQTNVKENVNNKMFDVVQKV